MYNKIRIISGNYTPVSDSIEWPDLPALVACSRF